MRTKAGKITKRSKTQNIFQDPEDFYTSYTSMLDYVNNNDNWQSMEEELRGRGVSMLHSKTCLKRPLKNIVKTKILMTIGSLMKVKSIGTFCNTFELH